jgi:hypothetical protein
MKDFTELFTETLNTTIARMVEQAVAAQAQEIAELKARIEELESSMTGEIEAAVDSAVEQAVDGLDFEEIVSNNIPGFEDMVRDVIVGAFR